MFLRQLSSAFLPRCRPPRCRAGLRSSTASSSSSSSSSSSPPYLPSVPAPRPWWSVQGFPPWPPRLPRSPPASLRLLSPRSSRRWLHRSAGLLMERHSRDRGPPQKRRKSSEENRSVEGREAHRGGAAGAMGGSKRELHHPDPGRDRHPRPNHRYKDERRERGSDEAGNGRRRDDTPHQGRGPHQQGSQPPRAWTQTPKSKPEPDKAPPHKPNPWFKGRGAEEPGGGGRNTNAPERQFWDRGGGGGGGGGKWAGPPSQPCRNPVPTTPWQVAGANREPPPPGTWPTVGQQEDAPPGKPSALQRHWETPACSAGVRPPGGGAAFDFSVMSYNILSQDLLQDNAYLYRHCHPAVLHWSHRLPNLLAEIRQLDADILCLQEVQQDHYENQIRPALQGLGYQCEYKKRTGSKPDGCAVVFKSSRLSLVSSNPVEFFRPSDALLDRDNVGLVVLLRPNDPAGQSDPSACICVANTHLLYNPRRGDIKLAQLAILLAEIDRLSRLPDGLTNPVVLCGDFNSTPWSPLYSFLTTGGLDYRGLQIGKVSGQEGSPRGQRLLPSPIWSHSLGIDHQCRYREPTSESCSPTAVEGAISNLTVEDLVTKSAFAFNRARIEHTLKLQSSYQHRLMPDGRPEITTCHSRTAMTVDYIMYTPESATPPSLPGGRGLHLLGRLSLVGQSELEEVNGLPNRCHSSDHLPLLARFRLRR